MSFELWFGERLILLRVVSRANHGAWMTHVFFVINLFYAIKPVSAKFPSSSAHHQTVRNNHIEKLLAPVNVTVDLTPRISARQRVKTIPKKKLLWWSTTGIFITWIKPVVKTMLSLNVSSPVNLILVLLQNVRFVVLTGPRHSPAVNTAAEHQPGPRHHRTCPLVSMVEDLYSDVYQSMSRYLLRPGGPVSWLLYCCMLLFLAAMPIWVAADVFGFWSSLVKETSLSFPFTPVNLFFAV